MAAGLPGPEAALARGMVLGQDEAIAEGVREDFRQSGLAHLLAVSGQNVMLLVALALPFLAAGGVGPRARGVALLLLVALYVPLAGAGPSLQRAGVMGVCGDRRDDPVATLLALVRAPARRGGDAVAQPAKPAGSRLAALVCRRRRDSRPRGPAGRRPEPRGGPAVRIEVEARDAGRSCGQDPVPRTRRGHRRSRWRPLWPPLRCWRITSRRCRSPRCPPICSLSRPWPRPCGSAWSRLHSVCWLPHCRVPTGWLRRSGRSPAYPCPTWAGSRSAARTFPAARSACRRSPAGAPRWPTRSSPRPAWPCATWSVGTRHGARSSPGAGAGCRPAGARRPSAPWPWPLSCFSRCGCSRRPHRPIT